MNEDVAYARSTESGCKQLHNFSFSKSPFRLSMTANEARSIFFFNFVERKMVLSVNGILITIVLQFYKKSEILNITSIVQQ